MGRHFESPFTVPYPILKRQKQTSWKVNSKCYAIWCTAIFLMPIKVHSSSSRVRCVTVRLAMLYTIWYKSKLVCSVTLKYTKRWRRAQWCQFQQQQCCSCSHECFYSHSVTLCVWNNRRLSIHLLKLFSLGTCRAEER